MTAVTKKIENYSADMVATIVGAYAGGSGKSVADIATEVGKSERSVRARLVLEKVYVKKQAANVTATKSVKGETAKMIGRVLKMSEGEVSSLSGANKSALDKVWKALAESKPV